MTFNKEVMKNWIRNIFPWGGVPLNNRVYVGNLSWSATEQDLNDVFSAVGTVTETKLITDRETGKSRGFAFVTFKDDASATKAIEDLNETDMMGRRIRVSLAEQKQRTGGGAGPRREFSNSGGGGGNYR